LNKIADVIDESKEGLIEVETRDICFSTTRYHHNWLLIKLAC